MYLICTLPRAGGHLLISLLNSTGVCGNVTVPEMFDQWETIHGEHFGDGENATDKQLEVFFDNECVSPETQKFVGAKCWHYNMPMILRMFELKGIGLSDIKWIYLRRENLVKQAISNVIALESDRWHFYDRNDKIDSEHLDISLDRIRDFFCRNFITQLKWESCFAEHGIDPFRVAYEDFEYPEQWQGKISEILDYFGVDYELPLDLSSNFHRTSTDLNERLYEEFIDSYGEVP